MYVNIFFSFTFTADCTYSEVFTSCWLLLSLYTIKYSLFYQYLLVSFLYHCKSCYVKFFYPVNSLK